MAEILDDYDVEKAHGHSTECAWKRADYHCREFDCTARHDRTCTSTEHGIEDPEPRSSEATFRNGRAALGDVLRTGLVAA